MKSTKIIVFEGGEKCGKTTQVNILVESLIKEGYKVFMSREPGGCEVAEEIRNTLLKNRKNTDAIDSKVEELLFLAARRAHLLEKIKPVYESGEYDFIILDRFIASSAVYQGYASDSLLITDDLSGFDEHQIRMQEMKRVYDFNMKYVMLGDKLFIPHHTVVLVIDPDVAMKRFRNEEEMNRIDNKKIEYHKLINRGYSLLEHLDGFSGNISFINADDTVENVAKTIITSVAYRLNLGMSNTSNNNYDGGSTCSKDVQRNESSKKN